MPETIIADASCLIILQKIGRLEILRETYEGIVTTSAIASEYGLPLPNWASLRDPIDSAKERELNTRVDKGEASAIALALELENTTLVIDDQKARKVAVELGIQITGTIGVIVRAKLNGRISSIRPVLEEMQLTNFRFSEQVEQEALRQAGE